MLGVWAHIVFTGSPAYVSSLRRRVDVYRQEPVFQDGVERDGVCTTNKDHSMQERRRHRGWKEVTYLRRLHHHPHCTIDIL
jgi:hypothetical protein